MAKEKWYKNKIKNDRIQRLRMQLSNTNENININKTLDELRSVQTIRYNGRQFNEELKLSDCYKPSDEMKEYQLSFV